jgi:hypothetical protein
MRIGPSRSHSVRIMHLLRTNSLQGQMESRGALSMRSSGIYLTSAHTAFEEAVGQPMNVLLVFFKGSPEWVLL